jgi:hypothetical protein
VAEAEAAVDGVKVTVMVQVAPAASDKPQVLVAMVKEETLVPLRPADVMGSVAVPALVKVKVWSVLVDPTVTLPKFAVAGVSAAFGAVAVVPVPLRAAVCGEPVALSATETDALALAAVVGVRVTEIVQLAPTASVGPQVLV